MIPRMNNSVVVSSIRRSSSLVDKLRIAASSSTQARKTGGAQLSPVTESVANTAFNELFVIPKRKLRGQMQIEHTTGRTAIVTRSRYDIHDRLSVRNERSTEMSPDQDWTSVWPAARTFNASVVPLPVRMGTRPDPDKRAPFKKQGNLELVKIPNFLHLTPAAIEKHCNALKQFCTKFPSELETSMEEHFPVSLEYSTYVHQGTNIRDPRARVVTMKIKLESLCLEKQTREKFIRLAGNKYDEASDTLTIITDRCHTRKQNLDYADYLLTVLYHEANKQEAWENARERADNLKVEFEGSKCKTELNKMLGGEKDEQKMNEFAEMWTTYRNTEETPENTRKYAEKMRQLMGVRAVAAQ